jgi:hypothetical protein
MGTESRKFNYVVLIFGPEMVQQASGRLFSQLSVDIRVRETGPGKTRLRQAEPG